MTPSNLKDALAQACEWACQAGKIIMARWGRAVVQRKADGSPVTDADLAAEEYLVEAISKQFAGHDVLAEESAATGACLTGSRHVWIVDPLDGTRNFTRGFPCVATSIALVEDGTPVVGVIREHLTGRTYTAAASQGAWLDAAPLRVAKRPMDRGFFVGVPSVNRDESPAIIKSFLDQVNVRSIGSTAMHLALVACGAIDAACALRCYSWDIAAGCLLIAEAGGVCTDPAGGSLMPLPPAGDPARMTPLLAAGPHAHAALAEMVRRADIKSDA